MLTCSSSILLLHGFTGHPDDLEPLDLAFTQAGFTCHRPALPGHATHPSDLQNIKAGDWLSFVRGYNCDVIVGLSMGALLAIILASEKPPKKLILISPAFILKPFGRFGVWASKRGLLSILSRFRKTAGSDIEDPIARAQSKAYGEVPLKALLEFDAIRERAIKALPELKCPMFSFFGAKDHVVDVPIASLFVNRPIIFPNSAHILPLDYDKKELTAQCLKILEK